MEAVKIVARELTGVEKRELYESVGWGHLFSEPENDPMLFTVVAVLGGRAVGAASMAGNGVNCFVLRDVMVLFEFQGRGIGGLLMDAIWKWVEEEVPHGRSVILLAPEERVRFYQRHGFVGPNHGVIGMRRRT